MRFFVAVIFLVLNNFPASAASLESWADLVSIINSKKIANIDDLLANLPADYTKGYTLVYRTRALNQEKVSPRRPRVLLFGQNAKLVLAYNSHVTGGKARPGDVETIETLEFDDATGWSFLREVQFDGMAVPNLDVAVNPDKCLACHAATSNPGVHPGNPPGDRAYTVRGLWDPYNSWAGVYGSLSRNDLDFISFDTWEVFNFQQFLREKPKNPRYDYLPLGTKKLSELIGGYDPGLTNEGYDPGLMNDALTFSNGYSSNPNQILGMYLADYNFRRVGKMLADLPIETRAAFQYLIRGLTVDEESFVKPDIDDHTNPTQVNDKTYLCLDQIASFLPDSMSKISFDDFAAKLLTKLRVDYAGRKALVEVDNMGLSKGGAGFDPKDPYDENRNGRRLGFDSINAGTYLFFYRNPAQNNQNKVGYWEGTALFYLFYLMGLPSQDFNTAITRGYNMPIDTNYVVSGSASITYGNAARCYTLGGKVKHEKPDGKGMPCDSGGADEFFTEYLPPSFYPDREVLGLTSCDELATRSKAALTSYVASH